MTTEPTEGMPPEQDGGKRASKVDRMVRLVQDLPGVELFHSPDGHAFISIPVESHRETWRLNTRSFLDWAAARYFGHYGKAIGTQALQSARDTLAGAAKFAGPSYPVHVRVAEHEGVLWLDLCDADWRAVRIDTSGWRVVTSMEVPVRFVRRPGMDALPEPVPGGSIDELRPLVNLPDDDLWILAMGWTIGALSPHGPYAILAAVGEAGSAKSSLCRYLRGLVDPSTVPLRRPPKDEREVFIGAANSWIVGYDNLSGIRPDLADTLCTLATGGGFGVRTLYADDDETLFSLKRPLILNGIDSLGSRADLLGRMVTLNLLPISDDVRRDEASMDVEYQRIRPRVLGALLNAVSMALRLRGGAKLDRTPRMADFTRWVTAAETGLGWEPGTFARAYQRNCDDANALAIESSPIGPAIMGFMAGRSEWTGTAGGLRIDLDQRHQLEGKPSGWPRSDKAMASALRRIAPNLRASGLQVDLPKGPTGHDKRRIIRLAHEPGRGALGGDPAVQNTCLIDGRPVETLDDLLAYVNRPKPPAADADHADDRTLTSPGPGTSSNSGGSSLPSMDSQCRPS